jgi:probable rRNA maturation factor
VTFSLSVQFASTAKHVPSRAQVRRWAFAAHKKILQAVVTIRYVDEKEGRALNLAFRNKDYATNVLTFVHDEPTQRTKNYAADIVICAPVIAREAREQKKPIATHHGHMVIHGMLHAQGFDHEMDDDAINMEAIEIALLNRFRIKNPYEIE